MKQSCSLLLASALLASCSSSTSSDNDDRFGESSFNLSGDISGQKSGMADFYSTTQFGISIWEVDMYDFKPSTFSLVIMAF